MAESEKAVRERAQGDVQRRARISKRMKLIRRLDHALPSSCWTQRMKRLVAVDPTLAKDEIGGHLVDVKFQADK